MLLAYNFGSSSSNSLTSLTGFTPALSDILALNAGTSSINTVLLVLVVSVRPLTEASPLLSIVPFVSAVSPFCSTMSVFAATASAEACATRWMDSLARVVEVGRKYER